MNNQEFSGKVALVTGGSRGIGKETAIKLASLGCDLAILARTSIEVNDLSMELKKNFGVRCLSLTGDVSNWKEMNAQFLKLTQEFGRLDILINVAGINIPKSITETSLEEWNKVIAVNLTGTFICCKLGTELMMKRNSGVIINISSVQSRVGGRSVQYSASKAGIEGLTKSLARQLASNNIRIVSVAPGGTDTDMARKSWSKETRERLIQQTLLNRIAEPEEIASVIVFAASSDASYITGSTIHVNGGFHLD